MLQLRADEDVDLGVFCVFLWVVFIVVSIVSAE